MEKMIERDKFFWESEDKQFVQDVGDFICDNFPFIKEDNQAGGCTEWRNWKYIKDDKYVEIDVFNKQIRVWFDKEHILEDDTYDDIEEFKEEIIELFKNEIWKD